MITVVGALRLHSISLPLCKWVDIILQWHLTVINVSNYRPLLQLFFLSSSFPFFFALFSLLIFSAFLFLPFLPSFPFTSIHVYLSLTSFHFDFCTFSHPFLSFSFFPFLPLPPSFFFKTILRLFMLRFFSFLLFSFPFDYSFCTLLSTLNLPPLSFLFLCTFLLFSSFHFFPCFPFSFLFLLFFLGSSFHSFPGRLHICLNALPVFKCLFNKVAIRLSTLTDIPKMYYIIFIDCDVLAPKHYLASQWAVTCMQIAFITWHSNFFIFFYKA